MKPNSDWSIPRSDEDHIVVMGLNNYSQLALPTTKGLSFFMPHHSKEMTTYSWSTIAIGQHHAICLEQVRFLIGYWHFIGQKLSNTCP